MCNFLEYIYSTFNACSLKITLHQVASCLLILYSRFGILPEPNLNTVGGLTKDISGNLIVCVVRSNRRMINTEWCVATSRLCRIFAWGTYQLKANIVYFLLGFNTGPCLLCIYIMFFCTACFVHYTIFYFFIKIFVEVVLKMNKTFHSVITSSLLDSVLMSKPLLTCGSRNTCFVEQTSRYI